MPACQVVVAPPIDPCNGIFGTQVANAQQLEQAFVSSSTNAAASIQPILWGPSDAFGTFCGGSFGITSGIVVSTGRVSSMGGRDNTPGTNDGPTAKGAMDFGVKGAAGDDIGFELAFTSSQPGTLRFRYVFASRELPEYMGQKYNDVFQLLVNGINVAKLSNGQDVTINNLGSSKSNPASWSPDYVDNPSRQHFGGLTGYTKVLTAQSPVQAGTQTVLNVTLRDIGDGIFDSVVFLEGNSFSLNQVSFSSTRRSSVNADGTRPLVSTRSTQGSDGPFDASQRHADSGGHAAVLVGMVAGAGAVVFAAAMILSAALIIHNHKDARGMSTSGILRLPGTRLVLVRESECNAHRVPTGPGVQQPLAPDMQSRQPQITLP
jgi:hypothetical protein